MIDVRLTEAQLEALRVIYVFQKTGAEPDAHAAASLVELGLASRLGDGSFVRTELGVGYLRNELGWTWGYWEHPHLPSPPPTVTA